MTFQEFLVKLKENAYYTPFYLDVVGKIRSINCECPIECVARSTVAPVGVLAKCLGLSPQLAEEIIGGADNRVGYEETRKQLLNACNLT